MRRRVEEREKKQIREVREEGEVRRRSSRGSGRWKKIQEEEDKQSIVFLFHQKLLTTMQIMLK